MKKIILIMLCVVICGCNNVKEKETFINVKSKEVHILENENYNYLDNIVSSNNEKVVCQKNNDTINCKLDNKEVSYKIIYTVVTKNKNIIFFGDSITYGFLTKGYSWAEFIKDNYDFNIVINAGISDYRVSTFDDKNKWLTDTIISHANEKYDYVIMQGGINDVLYNTPLGEISNSKSENDFDVNTFAGGFESYIYNAKKYFKDAKIGYIITYYTPNYTERGQKWSYDDYNKYIMMTKKILDKWNIKYLDLFNEEYSNILKVNTKTYLPDNLHLNYEGYKIIYPYIYDFIKSL